MGLQVGGVVVLITLEVMGFNHIFQDTLHIGIEHLHRQLAALGSFQDSLILLVLSGLQHIVACQHRSNGIVASVPVRHIHTLPAPLIAYDGGQQLTVLHGIRAVQLII